MQIDVDVCFFLSVYAYKYVALFKAELTGDRTGVCSRNYGRHFNASFPQKLPLKQKEKASLLFFTTKLLSVFFAFGFLGLSIGLFSRLFSKFAVLEYFLAVVKTAVGTYFMGGGQLMTIRTFYHVGSAELPYA